MALRILTGVLRPRAGHLTNGEAKISFDPHMVGGDAAGMDLEETGLLATLYLVLAKLFQ